MKGNLKIKSESVRSEAGMDKMRVSLYEKGKLIEQTVMSLKDYISLLENSTKKDEGAIFLPVNGVPDGFVDGVLSNKEGTLGAIIYIPPRKHQFILAATGARKEAAYHIPMPGLVYECIANKGSKHTFKCFACKEWNGDETELYHYPWGNVGIEGNICMGSVKGKALNDFFDIREYIESSLNGITNADYLPGDFCRLSVSVTQHDFCDQISGQDEFPMELLLAHHMESVGKLKEDFRRIITTL